MQVRADCADGQPKNIGDLLITLLLLMVEDHDRTLRITQLVQMLLDSCRELGFFHLLGGVGCGMGEPVFPCSILIGERYLTPVFTLTPLPLVLSDVHGNSIEIGAQGSFTTKVRQRTKQPEEDILREIFERVITSSEPRKCAKDHLLMIADDLLEVRLVEQSKLTPGPIRPQGCRKVSSLLVKLPTCLMV